MGTAVIAGGSVAGLATALALAEAGYRVRVLERAAPPPEGPAGSVAAGWRRPTVPQSHHSHTLTSLGVRVLRERAPQVLHAALEAGAALLDLTTVAPRADGGFTREPADAELAALAIRRSVLDLVLYRVVRADPRIEVSHGVTVRHLVLDGSRRRVRGVVDAGGRHLAADVVVDAGGRRGLARSWLADAGVPVAEDLSSPSGLRGFSRFYRLTGTAAPAPLNRGNAAGGVWDHYAGVLHPGDNHTFAIALAVLPDDATMTALRHPAGFTEAACASPYVAPWVAEGVSEPLGPVEAITCPPNVLRGVATRRQEPVAGLFSVGDAACVTNPLFGRGLSLALTQAFQLADMLAAAPAVDETLSAQVAAAAEDLLRPWYEQSTQADADRIAVWSAAVAGEPPMRPGPRVSVDRPSFPEVAAAASADAHVWRGLTRMLMSLETPAKVFDDAVFRDRVAAARPRPAPAAARPPARDALAAAVTAAKGAGR
ncbi:NAD(P)/FAD-dependent oxidoreductase [Streptomyces inhibens]|uniref:NAD(P)/FAD-dependent oxidoreductase n=1 Tax=Streptomyces inhibens TaxID=2293571 RepID=UPI00402ACCDE